MRSVAVSKLPEAAHRVLLRERGEHHRGLDAERGELGVGDLDEDLLVLLADQLDLGDVLHAQQLGCGSGRPRPSAARS